MPTVVEYLGLKFKINVRDHNPPHVQARVNLLTLEPMTVNGFSKKDMRSILTAISHYKKELMEVWDEFHK